MTPAEPGRNIQAKISQRILEKFLNDINPIVRNRRKAVS